MPIGRRELVCGHWMGAFLLSSRRPAEFSPQVVSPHADQADHWHDRIAGKPSAHEPPENRTLCSGWVHCPLLVRYIEADSARYPKLEIFKGRRMHEDRRPGRSPGDASRGDRTGTARLGDHLHQGDPHCEQGRGEAGHDQIRAHRLSPWYAAEITEQWLDLV